MVLAPLLRKVMCVLGNRVAEDAEVCPFVGLTPITRLRKEAGISDVTVREMDAFAPVVARLS